MSIQTTKMAAIMLYALGESLVCCFATSQRRVCVNEDKKEKQMITKMASEEPANEQELLPVEDSLMSLEKLDRASPDLWPEQTNDEVPGVNEYVAQNSPQIEPPSWAASLSADDINKLHQLGNLSMTGLIAEVKKLHDSAYQLGLEEAKEMTRGKYLNIFKQK